MITAHRVGAQAPAYVSISTTDTYDDRGLDLIAIERTCNGQAAALTPAERLEAARILHGRGHRNKDIATLLGVRPETVRAWRDRSWQPPLQHAARAIDIGSARHGRSGYSKGCRCDTCRAGARDAARARRQRRKAAA